MNAKTKLPTPVSGDATHADSATLSSAEPGYAPIVTNVSASDGTVTVTKGEITIPVGSPTNPTYHTTIWLK